MSNYREFDTKTLKKLHYVQLNILDEFVRICDKHKLNYFLIGGTFLGAIRHSGFIPWDDDIDVGMPRKDYERFLKIAKDELDSNYYLDCFMYNKDYYLPFAKIKKNKTLFDEEVSHHLNNHKGIYMDIFPLDNVPKVDFKLKIKAIMALSITDAVAYKYKLKKLSAARHSVLSFLLSVLRCQKLMKWQKKIVTYCKDDNSKYMCDIGTGYGYRRELLLRKDVLPTREIEFEGKKYKCMKTDAYLKNVYGDYMQLPPKEKRRNHMPLAINFGEDEND